MTHHRSSTAFRQAALLPSVPAIAHIVVIEEHRMTISMCVVPAPIHDSKSVSPPFGVCTVFESEASFGELFLNEQSVFVSVALRQVSTLERCCPMVQHPLLLCMPAQVHVIILQDELVFHEDGLESPLLIDTWWSPTETHHAAVERVIVCPIPPQPKDETDHFSLAQHLSTFVSKIKGTLMYSSTLCMALEKSFANRSTLESVGTM